MTWRRLLGMLLCVVVAPLSVAPRADAAAAGTGVLSATSFTSKSSTTKVSEVAEFTTHGETSLGSANGLSATFPGTLWRVTVAPPTDQRFVSGTSYPTRVSRSADSAKLTFANFLPFTSSACTSTSSSGALTGTLNVQRARYTDDLLTEFSADYSATCLVSGLTESVHGSIRLGSAVPWSALQQENPTDTVPLGESRETPVRLTAMGPGSVGTLGAADVTGSRAADYSIAQDSCRGVALAPGESCEVMLRFAPEDLQLEIETPRIATLQVESPGSIRSPLRVRLASSAQRLPGQPGSFTTYPVVDGIGLAVGSATNEGDGYYLDRLGPDGSWQRVAQLPAGPSRLHHIDRDVTPGQSVTYRAASYAGDWVGPAVQVSATRPAEDPVPTTGRSVSFGTLSGPATWHTITDGVDGATVSAFNNGVATISATGPQSAPNEAPDHADVTIPLVPGPGEYRDAGSVHTSPQGCFATGNDSTVETILRVREVLYDDNRVPLVFDASWTSTCPRGGTRRVEIRLAVDASDHLVSASPGQVGRLTTWAANSREQEVRVTNHGATPAVFGAHTFLGVGAPDWSMRENACSVAPVQPGESCALTVSFSATADGARPAALRLDQSTTAGPASPVLITLDGFGATPPLATGSAVRSVGVNLVTVGAHDGGMPVLSYDLERRERSTSAWTPLTSLPSSTHPGYADGDLVSGQLYDYRVRATSEVGTGPWNPLFTRDGAGVPTTVYSGSTSGEGLRGLFQVGGESYGSPVLDLSADASHDYRDPAVWGYRLTSSVSVGDGSDGEYDLWTGTLRQPTRRRLTSLAGAERHPVYSSDGQTIAFTRMLGGGSSVWTVPATGGDATLVRSSASHPAWSPDGSSLVVADTSASSAPLLRVQVPSMVAAPIEGTAGGRDPAVSPTAILAFVDTQGNAVEMAPGASTTTARIGNWLYPRDLVYDADGKLWASRGQSSEAPWSPTPLLAYGSEPAPISSSVPTPALHLTTSGFSTILDGSVTFSWSSDHPRLVSGYDVQVREATPNQDFSAYHAPAGWSDAEQTDLVTEHGLSLAPGDELCLRATLEEGAGPRSRPQEECVARPIDDRALAGPGAARRVRSAGAYLRTLTSIAKKGVVLRTATLTTRQVGVLATTCPTCGAVRVKLGARLLGTVSLKSPTERHKVLLSLPALSAPSLGRVSLTTTSARRVRVDGLLLRRS